MVPIFPELLTPLPGPKTQALINRDHQVTSPSYTRGYPLSVDHGFGAMVVDVDGNRFLDFCAGIAVTSTGHSHPEIVRVIQQQAARFIHMSGTDFYYEAMARLAERLTETSAIPAPCKVFFGNSGAEAIEGAIKLARYVTGRQALISFTGAFHGRTMGALSLGTSKVIQRQGFSPLLPGIYYATYPNLYRNAFGAYDEASLSDACLNEIEHGLFQTKIPPHEVAAFIIEPIQGEGGYIVPPPAFMRGLRALADQYGILIIADEVQSGMGRTGKLWAFEHVEGFTPDIITSAKGLASGLPLGAVIARADLMTWKPGAHASTFGGNPISCEAALKTLDLLYGGLMHNAQVQGERLLGRLRSLKEKYPGIIGDVRGIGLMVGVEIVRDPVLKTYASDWRDAIVDAAYYQGLLILGCGKSSIRFCPPLVICEEQVDKAVELFEVALKQLKT